MSVSECVAWLSPTYASLGVPWSLWSLPLNEESFFVTFTRSECDALLSEANEGTFLVRRADEKETEKESKSKPNSEKEKLFFVSYVCGKQVVHLRIVLGQQPPVYRW